MEKQQTHLRVSIVYRRVPGASIVFGSLKRVYNNSTSPGLAVNMQKEKNDINENTVEVDYFLFTFLGLS